ncbi:MAG: sirohydrochlorin cobaltochelatase [Chloroflexota bacterium]|nr:sirohydrochlorin cobaltochelatase [Chloroflexota bacterium]
MKLYRKFMMLVMVICLIVSSFALVGCGSDEATPAAEVEPVIVIAAFGTSVASGQENLEDFDTMVRERFPDYDVRWGLTAGFIINKLRKAGQTTLFEREVPIKSVDEVYADLRAEGKTNVAVQCLLMMPGSEFREVLSFSTAGLNVKYGYPLLFSPENMQNAMQILADNFAGGDAATILCAHGNDHHPDYNAPLIEADEYLRANYDNVYLASVEGPPGTDCFTDVAESGAKKVHFIPFMIVSGDHIENDVMGDEPEAWKVELGLPATADTGLGSNPEVMGIFMDSLDSVLSQF